MQKKTTREEQTLLMIPGSSDRGGVRRACERAEIGYVILASGGDPEATDSVPVTDDPVENPRKTTGPKTKTKPGVTLTGPNTNCGMPTGPKTKVGLTYIAKVQSEEHKVGEFHMAKTKVG
jgi:hypothetical protein